MGKKKNIKKFDIKAIKDGALVGQVRDAVIEFYHNGDIESVDVRIKQLSYAMTDPLNKRLNERDESVVAEWIALALVDENDQIIFTKEQVEENFTQALAHQVFAEVSGLKALQEYAEKLGKESAMKMNSGQSLSSTESVDEP